jgi:NADH-quinone oxidoreductase subunit C
VSEAAPEILARLQDRLGEAVTPAEAVDMPTVWVAMERLLETMRWLRDEEGFVLLTDVTAVDLFPARPRFAVVYHLLRPDPYARLRVKVRAAMGQPVPSVTAIWPGANWPERETYDMFGIAFSGHPNLTRIYMPDDWEGHPLRKDYPTRGPRAD